MATPDCTPESKKPLTPAERSKRWRQAHPDRYKSSKRQWEANNPDKVKAQKQRSHLRCRAKNIARSKQWHHQNKDHVSILHRAYYAENRESVLNRVLKYQQENPDKVSAVQRTRRLRKLNAPGVHSAADITALHEEQNGLCGYCGIRLFGKYQVDHVIPLSRGGGNEPGNLLLVCRDCNLSKKNRLLNEWEQVRGW